MDGGRLIRAMAAAGRGAAAWTTSALVALLAPASTPASAGPITKARLKLTDSMREA